jgi:hypothetical protein
MTRASAAVVEAAFRQQVFDVTEAQCEPEIEPDRLLDNL